MKKLLLTSLFALAACILFAEEDVTFDLAAATSRFASDEARLKVEYRKCVEKLDKPSEGIVVPVESHPDGSLKVDVYAGRAQFFDKDSVVWCGDVVVREYEPNGNVKVELNASACIVDRNTKSGWIEGFASGRYGKTKISGCGIYFSFPDEFVKISSKVAIESSDIKFEGVEL